MPRARLLVAGALLLLTAGCSSGTTSPGPTAAPPAATSSPTASATPSASTETTSCPQGSYLLTALEGRGAASGVGTITGGNIAVDFTGGSFTIRADGSQPARVDLGSVSAELRFNGEIDGTYSGDPSALQLTSTGARGDATVKRLGFNRSYSAGELGDQLIGSSTTARATCDDAAGTTVLDLPNAQLTLTRT